MKKIIAGLVFVFLFSSQILAMTESLENFHYFADEIITKNTELSELIGNVELSHSTFKANSQRIKVLSLEKNKMIKINMVGYISYSGGIVYSADKIIKDTQSNRITCLGNASLKGNYFEVIGSEKIIIDLDKKNAQIL